MGNLVLECWNYTPVLLFEFSLLGTKRMSMWSGHSGRGDTLNVAGSSQDCTDACGSDENVDELDELDETGGFDLLGFDTDTLDNLDAADPFLCEGDGSIDDKSENEMMDARFLFAETPHPLKPRMPLSLELHLATSPSCSTSPSSSNALLKVIRDARDAASPVSVQPSSPPSRLQLQPHVSTVTIQPSPLSNSAACAAESESLQFGSPTRGVVYTPTPARSPPPQSPSPSALPFPSHLRVRARSPSLLPVRSLITTSSVAKIRKASAASAKSISTPSSIPAPSSPSFSFSSKIRTLSSPGYSIEAKRTLFPIRAESNGSGASCMSLDLSLPSTSSPSSTGVGVLEVLDHVKAVGRFSKKQQGAISEFINLEREAMLISLEETMTANAALRDEMHCLSTALKALREDHASLIKKNAELGHTHHEIWSTLAGDLVRVTGERDALAIRVAEAGALLKEAEEVEVDEVDVLMCRIVELEGVVRRDGEEKEMLQSQMREVQVEEREEAEAEEREALQNRIRELELELARMGSVNEAESEAVMVALKAENEALKKKVAKTQRTVTLSNAANQGDDEASQDLMATLSAQNETLSAALEALRSPIASDRLETLELENARLRAELQSHPAFGKQEVSELDARITVLQAEVSRLTEDKAQLHSMHEELVQCNAALQAELSRLREEGFLREAEMEARSREGLELRMQLSEALDSVERVNAAYKEMEGAFEGAKSRVMELEGTVCVLEEAGRDAKRQARRVEECEREMKGVRESMNGLKIRVEVLGRENEGLRSQLEDLKGVAEV